MKEARTSKQERIPKVAVKEMKPWKFAQSFNNKEFAGASAIQVDDLKFEPLTFRHGHASTTSMDLPEAQTSEKTTDLEISSQNFTISSDLTHLQVDSDDQPNSEVSDQFKRDLDDLSKLTPKGLNEISEMDCDEEATNSGCLGSRNLKSFDELSSSSPWRWQSNAHIGFNDELSPFTRVSSAPAMTEHQKEEIDFNELKKRFVIEKRKFAQNKSKFVPSSG
eukprot:768590-Hanusia_phi.AAC.8